MLWTKCLVTTKLDYRPFIKTVSSYLIQILKEKIQSRRQNPLGNMQNPSLYNFRDKWLKTFLPQSLASILIFQRYGTNFQDCYLNSYWNLVLICESLWNSIEMALSVGKLIIFMFKSLMELLSQPSTQSPNKISFFTKSYVL